MGKGATSKANVSACLHDATEASADAANSSVEPEVEGSTCSTCGCENMHPEGLTSDLLHEAGVRDDDNNVNDATANCKILIAKNGKAL